MPFLVDGHNLIGQLPGISLADADDEFKLVMLLRRYALRKRAREVVVVFDRGVHGHPQQLNGYGVTCLFAHSPQDADARIIRRLQSLRQPRDWILVTSDRQLVHAAAAYGVKVMSSRAFADRLIALVTPAAMPQDEQSEIYPSEAEVAEWLQLFAERAADATAAAANTAPEIDHPRKSARAKPRKR